VKFLQVRGATMGGITPDGILTSEGVSPCIKADELASKPAQNHFIYTVNLSLLTTKSS
jgi:hypothetical protein